MHLSKKVKTAVLIMENNGVDNEFALLWQYFGVYRYCVKTVLAALMQIRKFYTLLHSPIC